MPTVSPSSTDLTLVFDCPLSLNCAKNIHPLMPITEHRHDSLFCRGGGYDIEITLLVNSYHACKLALLCKVILLLYDPCSLSYQKKARIIGTTLVIFYKKIIHSLKR